MNLACTITRCDYIGVVGRMYYTEGRAVKAGGAAGQGGKCVMMAVKPVVCGVGVKAQEVHDRDSGDKPFNV